MLVEKEIEQLQIIEDGDHEVWTWLILQVSKILASEKPSAVKKFYEGTETEICITVHRSAGRIYANMDSFNMVVSFSWRILSNKTGRHWLTDYRFEHSNISRKEVVHV